MAQASRPPAAGDIGRMQQEAMSRMREMQGGDASVGNGWSTEPNIPRQNRAPRRAQPEPPPARPQPPPPSPPPPPRSEGQQQRQQPGNTHGRARDEQAREPQRQKNPDTTLLQDILGAVGLDDDRVLILGLILILVNSKADATLILALCYLLL